MTRINIWGIAIVLMLAYAPASYAAKTVSLGLTLNGSEWNGDNGPGNTSFKSDEGGQFAFSGNYRSDRFYTGLSLQGGVYSFDSNAPDQFTSMGTISSSNIKVEHTDFDLLVGYYFWPNVSLFLDVKSVASKWRDTGYEQSFSGLGFGVTGFHTINSNWLIFGSLGFVNGDIKDDDVSSLGDGSSRALVSGAVFRLDQKNTLNFGIKLRNYEFDYDSGDTQEYSLNGLFFGYNHAFSL